MRTVPQDEFNQDGYLAYWDGYELAENPHDEDSDRWHGWRAGHEQARKQFEMEQGEGVIQ